MRTWIVSSAAAISCAVLVVATSIAPPAMAQPAPGVTPAPAAPLPSNDQREARARGVKFYPTKAECHVPRAYFEDLERRGWAHQYPCRALVSDPGTLACYITDCDKLP